VLKQKIAKNTGVIARLRYCVPRAVLLMLYHSLIEPYLYYCNIVWATRPSTALNELFRYQKKVIRIMTFSHWQAHSEPIFIKLEILNVFNINKLQIGCFVYNAVSYSLPEYFCTMFSRNSSVHSYSTRQSDDLRIVRYSSNLVKYTLRSRGPLLWNALPEDLKKMPSVNSFKRCYAKLLLYTN